jgi:hypothetical protein
MNENSHFFVPLSKNCLDLQVGLEAHNLMMIKLIFYLFGDWIYLRVSQYA